MGILESVLTALFAIPLVKRGVRKVLGRFGVTDEPQIIIHEPRDPTEEPFLVWWQIDVENQQREKCKWWPTKSAERCYIHLKFMPIMGSRISGEKGRWAADAMETLEYKTLVVGEEPSRIPIVMRSEQTHLVYIPMQPDIVYVTGTQLLVHRNDKERLECGQNNVVVSVHSGSKILAEKTLRLNIPHTGIEGFVLKGVEESNE